MKALVHTPRQRVVSSVPSLLRGLSMSLLAGLVLTGCAALGPDAPDSKVSPKLAPSAWRGSDANQVRAAGPWWHTLEDATLSRLVERALGSSPTLDIAQAKVLVARAARSQVFASGLPSLTSSAQASRSQSGTAQPLGQAAARLDASWELDLFGAVRRGQEGANARAQASEQALSAARVSLSAEVANAYVQYRACQSSRRLNQQDLASRQATLTLTRASVEAGATAPYLLNRTQASWEDARAQQATLTSQCEQLENLLSRLTGEPVDPLVASLNEVPPDVLLDKTLDLWAVGLPSDVLSLRPDVQAAQSTWAAASADVGLAMADQLPRFSLSGSLSYSAQDAGKTMTAGGWSFGPTLSLPLFDAGRRAGATQAAQARLSEARASYEAVVAQAVQEVNDGLSRYRATLERKAATAASAREYEQFFRAVSLRHQEGASSLLELEDARRVWLAASLSALSAKQEHLQAWVYLNKVTAGATP